MKKIILIWLTFATVAIGGEMTQAERIKSVFNNLSAENMQILDGFYAKDVTFVDPIGEHKGLDSVKAYYAKLYKNVESIRFDFTDEVSQENKHAMVWTMRLQTKSKLLQGPIEVQGNSVIVFNREGLVTYHRDYFDMGEFIYERLPGLGWGIRQIKQQMGK